MAWSKHKKILKLAKGFRGRANSCFRIAAPKVDKALLYAYRDRKNKKREFKSLWIERINAGSRQEGVSYSKLIHGIHQANIELNRKVLANIAADEPYSFKSVIDIVKQFQQMKV